MFGLVAGKKQQIPTFYTDHMLADLLRQERVGDQLYQVVDGVDAGMDRLESLDLLSDGEGVGHVGQIVLMISHAVIQAGSGWASEIGITKEMGLKHLSEASLGVWYSLSLCS